jgi:hypothetical protein
MLPAVAQSFAGPREAAFTLVSGNLVLISVSKF